MGAGDLAAVLSLCGDRMGWRAEALSAMQLISELATRPKNADAAVMVKLQADMATMVQDMVALKGVVSAHEEAIIELERELEGRNFEKDVGDGDAAAGSSVGGTCAEGTAVADDLGCSIAARGVDDASGKSLSTHIPNFSSHVNLVAPDARAPSLEFRRDVSDLFTDACWNAGCFHHGRDFWIRSGRGNCV